MKKFHSQYITDRSKVQLLNSNVWRMVLLMNEDRTKMIVKGIRNLIRPNQIKKLSNNL